MLCYVMLFYVYADIQQFSFRIFVRLLFVLCLIFSKTKPFLLANYKKNKYNALLYYFLILFHPFMVDKLILHKIMLLTIINCKH
jgi:hypothetical protein